MCTKICVCTYRKLHQMKNVQFLWELAVGEFGRIQQQQLATTKNNKKLTTQLRTKGTPIPPISQTRRIPSTVPAAPRKILNPQMPKKPTRTTVAAACLPACLQGGVWCVFLRPAKTAPAAIQELCVTSSQRSHFALTHPYRSAAAAYIARNKPTHPPTHSPTYPNRSLSRNPKPRPRCVRSKKPDVVTRVFGANAGKPKDQANTKWVGKKRKNPNKQTNRHPSNPQDRPFLAIPPPPPPPPPSLHRLQNCSFCALLRVKERRRRRREEERERGKENREAMSMTMLWRFLWRLFFVFAVRFL